MDYADSREFAIRDFLDGTGGKWDWDDFISLPKKAADTAATTASANCVPYSRIWRAIGVDPCSSVANTFLAADEHR
jgi:hypothetical protein